MDPVSNQAASSSILRGAAAVGLIVIICVGAYFAYDYQHGTHEASQAAQVARTFIKSSPVVETDLGPVVSLKRQLEARVNGSADRWKVDFSVTGKKSRGTVDMLVQNDEGDWNVPSAKLLEPASKPVNLL